jgi:hypothetical protein
MTVVYRSGNILTGLTSDPKPTLAQDEAIFFDTEKLLFYDFILATTTWRERSAGATLGSIISLA